MVTGAFKVINILILEKETHIILILFYMDQLFTLIKICQRNADMGEIIKAVYIRIKNRF